MNVNLPYLCKQDNTTNGYDKDDNDEVYGDSDWDNDDSIDGVETVGDHFDDEDVDIDNIHGSTANGKAEEKPVDGDTLLRQEVIKQILRGT